MGLSDGAAAFYTAPRPGGEGPNQDAIALIPLDAERAVIAVADGMGGLPGGREAAATAVSTLAQCLAEQPPPGSTSRATIVDAIELSNERILATGLGAATTLAVAEITPGTVRPYHVGDSEILVFGQRGRIKLQSVPHSPVGFALHAGMLDENQAISHEDRHLVSNALGTRDMRIEIGSPIPLGAYDTVIVCSDGLVDNLQFREICRTARGGPLDRGLRALAAEASRRMTKPTADEPSKPDDISIIAYRPRPGARLMKRIRVQDSADR